MPSIFLFFSDDKAEWKYSITEYILHKKYNKLYVSLVLKAFVVDGAL